MFQLFNSSNRSIRFKKRPNRLEKNCQRLTLSILMFLALGLSDAARSSIYDGISIERIPAPDGGYGYQLQYFVPSSIDEFWRFKTDFDNDILVTSEELIEHRLVESFDNSVITEDRYATAPGLRFLWQTTIIPNVYRLEFKLLNPDDCRHEFHYGFVQLTPDGSYTKVTQVAYFNFVGASFWVKYPWYGGMKSTLTKVAKWEQKVASNSNLNSVTAIKKYEKTGQR